MKFLLLLLFPIISYAQNCAPINYLTANNSPFEKIPVQDQDGAGICYAVSGAQLMNYHLIKSGQATEPMVHPVWAALKASRRVLDGGFEVDAINMTNSAGICEYSKVEESLNGFANNSGLRGNTIVGFLETFAMELNKGRENAFSAAVDVAHASCPDNIVWDLVEPQLSSLQGTSVQIFSRLFADNCRSDLRRFRFPRSIQHIIQNDEDAPTKLALLRNGPIAIGYCATAWENPGYEGQASPRDKNQADKDCGDHSSIAVGRKVIDNKCHILVRNSYGTGWGEWNQNRKCICRHKVTREWVDECDYDNHSSEDYTVEACYMGKTQLERNLTIVTTL